MSDVPEDGYTMIPTRNNPNRGKETDGTGVFVDVQKDDPWTDVKLEVIGPDTTGFTIGSLPAEPGRYKLVRVDG